MYQKSNSKKKLCHLTLTIFHHARGNCISRFFQIPTDTSPLDLGWRMEEGSMKFKWFNEILNDESEENNEAESKEESGGENDKENEAEDEGENEGKVFKLCTKYH